MTSCVLSLLFLFSLCSSISAAPPTGVIVRITNRATDSDVVKDYGLHCLRILLINQPLQRLSRLWSFFNGLTLTHLDVDQNNIKVRFLAGSGLQFEFRDLSFKAFLPRGQEPPAGAYVVTGETFSITLGVRLIQHEGHLGVELLPGDPGCKVQADRLRVDTNGLVGLVLNVIQFREYVPNLLISQLCLVIRDVGVPRVNTFLSGVAMEKMLMEGENINLHYALSGDVTVTSNSLDVPFTGVILHDHNVADPRIPALPTTGVVPVFTESNQMVYVGVSVDLFRTAGSALYNHGPFQLDRLEVNSFIQLFLTGVDLPEGSLQVALTGEPDITLNKDGLSISVEATAQSPGRPPLLVACRFKKVKVKVEGRLLLLSWSLLPALKSSCKVKSRTETGKVVAGFAKPVIKKVPFIIKLWYKNGFPIPLPEEMELIETKINYHDDYFVVGGSLTRKKSSSAGPGVRSPG